MWGTSFLLIAVALPVFGAVGVATGRVLFGAMVFGAIWWMRGRSCPFERKDIVPVIGLAVSGYALAFGIMPHVMGVVVEHSRHGSSFAGMMISLVPIMTIVVSIPLLGVLPSFQQLIGVIGGLGAMCLLFSGEIQHEVPVRDLLLASAVPFLYALSNTYIKRRFERTPPLALVTVVMSVCAVVMMPIAIAVQPIRLEGSVWVAIVCVVVLGAVNTAGGTYIFFGLLRNHGPLHAGMVSYIIPTVAMLMGWLRGETITRQQLIALGIIFVMVAITQRSKSRRIKIK